MVICLKQGADLHSAELMPLSLSFTFLVLAHPGSPEKRPLNGCVRARINDDDDEVHVKIMTALFFRNI